MALRFFIIFILSCLFTINSISLFAQKNNDARDYDLIIVLGNPANDSCKPSPIIRERVKTGVELFKKGTATRILFTGGAVKNNCNEAAVMKEYAILSGIPDSAIIVEDKAQNTYQNAFYSVLYMKTNNLTTAAIVTSQFHVKRACHIFSHYNIQYNMFFCENPADLPRIMIFIWKLREKVILACDQLRKETRTQYNTCSSTKY